MDVLLNSNATMATTSDLNWVESKWEQMYEGRNPLLVTGVFAFLMHEFVYFGRFIPFLICDFIPYFQKYKLQQVKCVCVRCDREHKGANTDPSNRTRQTQIKITGIVLKKYSMPTLYSKVP